MVRYGAVIKALFGYKGIVRTGYKGIVRTGLCLTSNDCHRYMGYPMALYPMALYPMALCP